MTKLEYIKSIIAFLESNHPQSRYFDILELVCDAAERNHLGFKEDTIDLLTQCRSWVDGELKQMKGGE